MRGVKNGDKIGRVIGIVPVLGALGIAIGYAVVIGWFIKYLIEAACGTLVTQPIWRRSSVQSRGRLAVLATMWRRSPLRWPLWRSASRAALSA